MPPQKGTLTVQCICGKGLHDVVMMGRQDPYLTIEYGIQKARTNTHQDGGHKPVWNETLTFQVDSGSPQKMEIKVKHEGIKNSTIGKATVDLSQVFMYGQQQLVQPLHTHDFIKKGEVHFVLKFTPDGGGALGKPAKAGAAYPGAPTQPAYPGATGGQPSYWPGQHTTTQPSHMNPLAAAAVAAVGAYGAQHGAQHLAQHAVGHKDAAGGYPSAPGQPAGGGAGYPPQGQAYPPAQGAPAGYPSQPATAGAGGYPQQGGATGYPAQGGAPGGYPQSGGGPGYPAQGGANAYPQQGGAPGSNTGYPQQPQGANPYGQPQGSFPPNADPYAAHQGGGAQGYPPNSGNSGYPPTSGAQGYPPNSGASGYPPNSGASGYPPNSGASGYPPNSGNSGYPPNSGSSGYPPVGGNPYPQEQQGYPPQQPGAYPGAGGPFGAYPGSTI